MEPQNAATQGVSHWSERLECAIENFMSNLSLSEPVITIVTPTRNTEPSWFLELAVSILEQSFLWWEWCIIDDCSSISEFKVYFDRIRQLPNVRIIELDHHHGISRTTNEGLRIASGKYVCFVDHDDVLARDALLRTVDSMEGNADAVYTDSDKIDESGNRFQPFFKPDWSPEFFRGVMYVGHLLAVRLDNALAIQGFDSTYDGVQDFEFFLRYSEVADNIAHVPEILYHWRTVPGSVAASSDAKGELGSLQRKAVDAHLARLGLPAISQPGNFPHRLKIIPLQRSTLPKVSIIIPTKDQPQILRKCLYSLFSKTSYPNFEVLCVDNESADSRALEEMKRAPVMRILHAGKFNFSKVNNLARKFSSGEYLVFMNNDIEVITPDWLEQMLYYAEQDDVGAVGPLLLYANGTVQHGGVVLGCRGVADHVSRGAPAESDGYAGSLSCAREVSAVTAACLMMRRSVFDEIGGFNEHFFTEYQDLDLCLKIRAKGMRIIFTPRAALIHHESLSRGTYYDMIDHNLLLDYWETVIKAGDPYYNPNLDVETCNYTIKASRASV
jgi:GT2 family glycosyltransferase